MAELNVPDPKAPPKDMQQEAKKERARRKECHGNWHPCSEAETCGGKAN